MAKKHSTNREENIRKCPVEKEMAKYELFSMASDRVDILSWWKSHEETLPTLAKMAKIVLTIPSSTAKSERIGRQPLEKNILLSIC